jgi:hypothetical protein
MKIKYLKITLLTIFVISISCSDEADSLDTPIPSGAILGKVKLYDKFENENLNFNDIEIKLIVAQSPTITIKVDSEGEFQANNIPFGNILVKINKPGYGIIDTLSFNHQKNNDTISTIKLAENLPFSFKEFRVQYNINENILFYHYDIDFDTSDSYLVSELICFGKDANVSLNNCNFYTTSSSWTNISFVNSISNASVRLSEKRFSDNGLKVGDLVYAVCYPIIHAPFSLEGLGYQNFEIVSYKIGNPSNISSFILQE